MDYALFLKSAKTLTPFFEEMAQIAWQHAIDQELREKIAEIGRKAEKAMLIATDVHPHPVHPLIQVLGLMLLLRAMLPLPTQRVAESLLFFVRHLS